eukprot:scaffold141346_cov39-Prasinocladus_malaysianus.AAC.2
MTAARHLHRCVADVLYYVLADDVMTPIIYKPSCHVRRLRTINQYSIKTGKASQSFGAVEKKMSSYAASMLSAESIDNCHPLGQETFLARPWLWSFVV